MNRLSMWKRQRPRETSSVRGWLHTTLAQGQLRSVCSSRPRHQSPDKKSYKHYLPVSIQGHYCGAIVDSGNHWWSIISEEFANWIGLGTTHIHPISWSPMVMTTSKGTIITMLGEAQQPLELVIRNTGKKYASQPAIVKGLAAVVNISRPWLMTKKWDNLHCARCLLIEGTRVLLMWQDAGPRGSGVYTKDQTVIPPHTGKAIPVVILKWLHLRLY